MFSLIVPLRNSFATRSKQFGHRNNQIFASCTCEITQIGAQFSAVENSFSIRNMLLSINRQEFNQQI